MSVRVNRRRLAQMGSTPPNRRGPAGISAGQEASRPALSEPGLKQSAQALVERSQVLQVSPL